MAKLGAKVTGLDPNEDMIKTAKNHLAEDKSISEKINYICDKIEDFAPPSTNASKAIEPLGPEAIV